MYQILTLKQSSINGKKKHEYKKAQEELLILKRIRKLRELELTVFFIKISAQSLKKKLIAMIATSYLNR